jgi:hypothetical protein
MSNMERYRKHVCNELVFVVDGDEFVVHPKKGDRVNFVKQLAKCDDSNVEQAMAIQTQFITELLAREDNVVLGTPEFETISMFVEDNLTSLGEQLLIKWKLISKDKVDEKKQSKKA